MVDKQGTKAPEPDDTEGHIARWSNRDLKEDIEPLDKPKTPAAPQAPDPDDTEGHFRSWSNRDLKEDIEPLAREPLGETDVPIPTPESTEDTEGKGDPRQ